MEKKGKKNAAALGARVGMVFLAAVAIVIVVAYYVLSQNFHKLLTDYTIALVKSMSEQGVGLVEAELERGRREVEALAADFEVPKDGIVSFPKSRDEHLRMVFVTAESLDGGENPSAGTAVTSDGSKREVEERLDIEAALSGENAIYGPYFDEKGEFVMCYTAPVWQDGEVAGALSVEKDGFYFCDLIKSIRFSDTGESYIIDAEGTDIAVSDLNHLDWVTTEYNARRLLKENVDEETLLIMELEQKGLDGETGVGTYYWNDGLVHVLYEPIPSVGWVLLSGLREEELVSMTQSVVFASISKGPTLGICLGLLLMLTALIVYWIISSTKRNAEINEKLEIIANHDSLTGLLNRRFLENSLSELWEYPVKVPSQAAVFMMDIDNFKQYNDLFGHPKGDECLRCIATIFGHAFDGYNCKVMRYGGEEFIAVVFMVGRRQALELGQRICHLVEKEALPNGKGGVVTVSIGISYTSSTLENPLEGCIKAADQSLYEAKRNGKNQALLLDGIAGAAEGELV